MGVLLLSLTPGYQPDLVSFLFGSILTVSRDSLLVIVTITVVVLGFYCVSDISSSLRHLTKMPRSSPAFVWGWC